jgi:glycosyltransferase involved in cell wall biosynthesis
MSLISVVVPAYNSEKTIADVVGRIKTLDIEGHEIELIVVDDCSKDKTWAKLQALAGITAIRHPRNTGKGGALRTGFQRARGEFLVMEDDDLEYDPREIPVVLKPLLERRADVVFGSRQLNPTNTYINPFYHLGGLALNMVIESVLHRRITDSISGTKAFTRRVYDRIAPIESSGFGVETEIAAKIVRAGFTLQEVPIGYRPRTHAEGKNIHWYHAYSLLASLIKHAKRASKLKDSSDSSILR